LFCVLYVFAIVVVNVFDSAVECLKNLSLKLLVMFQVGHQIAQLFASNTNVATKVFSATACGQHSVSLMEACHSFCLSSYTGSNLVQALHNGV